jgi:putative aldouronate transport system substrate-binding protein
MREKRCFLLLVVLMFVLLPVYGRGGRDASGSGAAKEAPGIVIGFWRQNAIPKDFQLVIDTLNEYMIPKYNVRIADVVANNAGNYRDQLTLMLSGNEPLDTFVSMSSVFPTYIARGQIIPLEDLVEKHGQGIVKAIGREWLDAGIVNGHQYGLTTNRDLATNHGFIVLQDILDKYNIDVSRVRTLADMEPIWKVIHDNEPTMAPIGPTGPGTYLLDLLTEYDPLNDTLGVLLNYGQDNTTIVNLFETEYYAKFCAQMRSWYQKGYVLRDILTNTDNFSDLLRSGRCFSFTDRLKPGYDLKASNTVQRRVKSIPVTQTYTSTSIVQTAQWVIARNSRDPEAAMRFLNAMYSDPVVTNLLAWGIEGKHYVIQPNRLINYPDGVNADNIGYNLNLGWVFGNQFITHIWEGDSPDLWKETDTFNRTGLKSKVFGFTYDATPVRTETAAVTNVVREYRPGLEYGVLDPVETIPVFISKLKDAGIDKIIAEKQRQLNAWLATQK